MNIPGIIKSIRADIVKLSVFIISFSLSLVYVMSAAKINIYELLDYLIRNLKF